MSKNWYPVIDYTLCTECGSCTDFCEHGVYDKKRAPVPVVIFPEGCIEGCRGCGSFCLASAISYIGEDLAGIGGCGCGCSCDGTGGSKEDDGGCCG